MSEYKKELATEMIEAFNNIGSRVDISEPEECEAIFDLIESKGFAIVPRETVDALQQRVGELEKEQKDLRDIVQDVATAETMIDLWPIILRARKATEGIDG